MMTLAGFLNPTDFEGKDHMVIFVQKLRVFFTGLTHPFTELPQEITKSLTGIQNQLSTKGQ